MQKASSQTSSHRGLSRRQLLRGVGATLALPFLEGLVPRVATAATLGSELAPQPTRLVYLYVPNGMHMPDFRPDK
ncbi:MAG: hypothetical protein ACKO9H_20510, partial [Planctomycetota bacterium]